MTVSYNLYSSNEASVLASRSKALGYDYQTSLLLISRGNSQAALDQIGRELGINDEAGEQNLTFDRYVNTAEDSNVTMYQGTDGMLYTLDFTTGSVKAESTESFAKNNGLINENGEKMYDIVSFGSNSAEFIDYKFDGLEDGLDEFSIGLNVLGNATWSSIKHTVRETNSSLWLSSSTSDDAVSSKNSFSNILKYSSQWLNSTDKAKVEESDTVEEYYERMAELAVKYLDQTGKAEYEGPVEEAEA